MGNNGDNHNINANFIRHSLYRGVYSRVARQLGLDRSYVSRVASGQRRSKVVEAALLAEVKRIEKLAGTRRAKSAKAAGH
ncbi:MAG TPA: hypothetical protein VM056_04820 [Terriglobales bacterium]|nr:hypothetical protein [Terriglobales bacterium]